MSNIFIDRCENEDEKKLLEVFFDKTDKLYHDMDNLDYESFNIRWREAYSIINEITKKHNSIYFISLYSLEAKAKQLYGDNQGYTFSKVFYVPVGNFVPTTGEVDIPVNQRDENILSRIKKWFHS